MVTLHLHVVGAEADGSACPLGRHIAGALVQYSGTVGGLPAVGQAKTGSNGVATIDFPGSPGFFAVEITVQTPKGRIASLPAQTGYWWNPVQDVTWVVSVPGACDEGSVGSDAGAWLGGFGGVVGVAIGIGVLALGTWAVVSIARSPEARGKVARTARRAYGYARGR